MDGAEKGGCGVLGLKMEIWRDIFPFDLAVCPTRLKNVPVSSLEVRGTLPHGG